jgi:hypothetical protein
LLQTFSLSSQKSQRTWELRRRCSRSGVHQSCHLHSFLMLLTKSIYTIL